jgi:hypothetical protein
VRDMVNAGHVNHPHIICLGNPNISTLPSNQPNKQPIAASHYAHRELPPHVLLTGDSDVSAE